MIPIEKNIFVVDEAGNEYEATYPKRAKGLVKNGRARFINENTICLACPPNIKLEDKTMSENTNTNIESNPTLPIVESEKSIYTIDYILKKLEEIAKDQAHITSALETLSKMKSKCPEDDGTFGQAHAIEAVVEAREATNRKLIAFYEKMYDDLKPQKLDTGRISVLNTLIETLGEGLTPMESKEALTEILATALQDFSKNI